MYTFIRKNSSLTNIGELIDAKILTKMWEMNTYCTIASQQLGYIED